MASIVFVLYCIKTFYIKRWLGKGEQIWNHILKFIAAEIKQKGMREFEGKEHIQREEHRENLQAKPYKP